MTTQYVEKIQTELFEIQHELQDKLDAVLHEFEIKRSKTTDIEHCEYNDARLEQLTRNMKIQLVEVNSALEKIENGTFGLCEVCQEEIEENRLLASPFARFCMACS